jgi:hypothetical protein
MVKEYYVVGQVEKEHRVATAMGTATIDMSWADGMIGVLPVFDILEAAGVYRDTYYPDFTIFSVQAEEQNVKQEKAKQVVKKDGSKKKVVGSKLRPDGKTKKRVLHKTT